MRVRIRKNETLLFLLCFYFSTKMLWDKLFPNVFELLSIGYIFWGCIKSFDTGKYSKNRICIIGLFLGFSLYVVFDSFMKNSMAITVRAMYEYVFYIAMIFSCGYFTRKADVENISPSLAYVGLLIAVLSWYEYLTRHYLIGTFAGTYSLYAEYSFRAAVFSRSYLCHGIILGFFSIVAMYCFLVKGKKLFLIISLFEYLSILTTSSRGPLVAAGVGLFLMYVTNWLKINKRLDKRMKITILAFVLGIVVFLFLNSTFTTGNGTIDYFLYRVRAIIDWRTDGSNVGRLLLWNNAFEWFKGSPLFGIGPSKTGSWGSASIGVTESGYLKHLCELGIIGTFILYLFIFSIIKKGVCIYKQVDRNKSSLTVLYFGLIAMVMTNNITLQSTEEIAVSFILAVGLGGLYGYIR